MIPVNNNGRLLLLVETPSNSQVRTLRAVTGVLDMSDVVVFVRSGLLAKLYSCCDIRYGKKFQLRKDGLNLAISGYQFCQN